ncbi:MAG: hypothetical protein GF317_04570 [Candidatus Lokiarchaeota archaeon]|nr:hypothetical protein [Candidatus Lokiarchaeota archaeon]
MKFIHTADWHLSASTLYGVDADSGLPIRLKDAENSISYLVDFAIENKVDFVLHCGDVTDSGNPDEAVRRVFSGSIVRLLEAGISFYCISGNHDLFRGDNWLKSAEILARHKNFRVYEKPVVKKIKNALLRMVPYGSYDMGAFFKKSSWKESGGAKFSVLASHLGINEGVIGANEVKFNTGYSYKEFSGYDYVALGHYHRCQQIENVFYSGSLLIHDFGERKEKKGFLFYDDGDVKFIENEKDRSFVMFSNRHFIEKSYDNEKFKSYDLRNKYKKKLSGAIVKVSLSLKGSLINKVSAWHIEKQIMKAGAVKVLFDLSFSKGNKKEDNDNSGKLIDFSEALVLYCEELGINEKDFINAGKKLLIEGLANV